MGVLERRDGSTSVYEMLGSYSPFVSFFFFGFIVLSIVFCFFCVFCLQLVNSFPTTSMDDTIIALNIFKLVIIFIFVFSLSYCVLRC